MSYTVEGRWKEQLVYIEDGQEFIFECGWGVRPYVAYIPSAAIWDRVMPQWMRGRREEIVARLATEGRHRLEDTEEGYGNVSGDGVSGEETVGGDVDGNTVGED